MMDANVREIYMGFFRGKMSLNSIIENGYMKVFGKNKAWSSLWLASIRLNPNDG